MPATSLHIGLLSVDHDDEELRIAAYALLGAVCDYLKYDKCPIVASKGSTNISHNIVLSNILGSWIHFRRSYCICRESE